MTSSWACRTLVERSVEHTTSYLQLSLCCSSGTYIKLLKRSRSLLVSTFKIGDQNGNQKRDLRGLRDQNGIYGSRTGPEADSRVQILNLPTRKHPKQHENDQSTRNWHVYYPKLCSRSRKNGIYGTGFTGLFFSWTGRRVVLENPTTFYLVTLCGSWGTYIRLLRKKCGSHIVSITVTLSFFRYVY